MKHAATRLEERALPVEAERAYALLRDHRKLAALVDLHSQLRPQVAAADRVALALSDGEGAAHLVATRDGRAVTCLGGGMAFSVPLIPWPAVQQHLAAQEESLRLRKAAASLRADEEKAETLLDSVRGAWRLSRDEFDALVTLGPLLVTDLNDRMVQMVKWVETTRVASGRRSPFTSPAAAFRLYASSCVTLMACQHERARTAALLAVKAPDTWLCGRGLWLLVNHAETSLPWMARMAETPTSSIAYATFWPLAYIAHRFSWHRKDALAVAERMATAGGPGMETFHAVQKALAEAESTRVLSLWAAWLVVDGLSDDQSPHVDEKAMTAQLRTLKEAPLNATWEELAHLGLPTHADALILLDPLREAYREPRLHARPERALTAEEAARVTLWKRGLHLSKTHLLPEPYRGLLATLAPVEAWLPPLPVTQEYGEWMMDKLLPSLHADTRRPVEAPKDRPGRNAPCPCGSGKKAKKCCLVS